MRLRHLATALILLAFTSAAHAKAPPRIDVLDKCKRGAACIDADVNIENLEERTIGAMTDVCKGPIIRLRGRLNGGRVADYRVGFPGICLDCGDAVAAYVGQSGAGNPIVLTTAGRFEIIDKSIRIGAPGYLALISMKSGKIVGRYWGDTRFGSSFFIENGRVYLRRHGGCLVAPRSAPRHFTRAMDKHCREERSTYFLDDNPDDETPAAVGEALRKLHEEDPALSSNGPSFHLRRTNIWVVQFGELCG